MENKQNILDELEGISKLVAYLNASNPYKVPEHYFEELPALILTQVNIPATEIDDLPLSLINPALKEPFQVPQTYFETLPGIILNRVKATEASPSEELRILSPLLAGLDKKIPFTTPEGYFKDLGGSLVPGISAIDLAHARPDEFSPLLENIKDVNVYKVPEGYFDHLAVTVLKKAKNPEKGKVIRAPFGKKVIRYAAAAVFAGLIAFGGWMYFVNKPSPAQGYDLSEIKQASDDEIASYLENNPVSPVESTNTASAELKEDDLKELLADIPDEELKQYLDQHALLKDVKTN